MASAGRSTGTRTDLNGRQQTAGRGVRARLLSFDGDGYCAVAPFRLDSF